MSGEWKARRFWTAADPRQAEGGWEVALDDRVLRTPGKLPLLLPTPELARAVAEEWQAQGDLIAPLTMPLTRAVNSAVERVTPQREAVAAMLCEYGGTDLLCYRAEAPLSLTQRQAAAWDPLLDWAAGRYGARLRVTAGILPVAQDAAALAALAQRVSGLDPFRLTALHDLVTLPGSLILGLAVLEGRLDPDAAHAIGRTDELFQAEQWGTDDEAEAAAAGRLAAMRSAGRLLQLLGNEVNHGG
ncbi:ATPase [Paracoccus sp. S-4012]|uniref:ATP12 family chaperone protein n=1 Tax=Paracoccus sp. S-4012 TaxID=2665648 RepID=UPI0012B153D4|nr:ATP12 family protein [Paracoccus sp. S-4012]MRX51033.1 ATPase [Paracoccus sp. S-4012]